MSGEGLETKRRIVGIDLGTTNCAAAWIDPEEAQPRVRILEIPQLIAPGETETRQTLPSFSYEPAPGEFPEPVGQENIVGTLARERGARTPGRLISSAKSWLSHAGVNRTAPLLPWQGAPDVPRISPVEASARYMQHIRLSWDRQFPQWPLAQQDVVVTVPASFDEVARELTVKAAEKAGIPRVTLLEEPQAAFYSWMHAHGERAEVRPGQLTLICDVGGGTSDFTLIEARATEDGIRFHRVAVGEHLILGGDNMDLALAHYVEDRLPGRPKLEPRRWGALVQACRRAKETFLGERPPDTLTLHVAGGAKFVGGAIQVELTRNEVVDLLVDGFFPKTGIDDKPRQRSGFQEFGLPYSPDAAITRHLACFLFRHLESGAMERARLPDRLLFNGGVFESPLFRKQLEDTLNSWRGGEPPVEVLPNEHLDLAVARGAAWFGLLRARKGKRIAAGLARAYYIEVGLESAQAPTAVCLAPAGLEEGHDITLPARFDLRIRQPVEFRIYSSSTRLSDKPGALVAIDPVQLTPLPPIRTVIKSGKSAKADTVNVQLHAGLTEIGTLDVRCVETGGNRTWKLEFDVRGISPRASPVGMGGLSAAASVEEDTIEAARAAIRRTFVQGEKHPLDPARLAKELEGIAGTERNLWPPSLLRQLWEQLMEVEPGRRMSVSHEARWLSLLGFALRPGYGYTVDDWRVEQTWKFSRVGPVFEKNELCRSEWWILWRRISGGLTAGQQKALAAPLAAAVRKHRSKTLNVWRGLHESSEIIRLLGALELVELDVKEEVGHWLLAALQHRPELVIARAGWWALGRIGARLPSYGPLNEMLPAEAIEKWLADILSSAPPVGEAVFAVVQMARLTGDRYRDIPDHARDEAVNWLKQHDAPAHYVKLVEAGGELDDEEEQTVFGDTLPPGLHLLNEA